MKGIFKAVLCAHHLSACCFVDIGEAIKIDRLPAAYHQISQVPYRLSHRPVGKDLLLQFIEGLIASGS